MGDSVQPRKHVALGTFTVTFSIFASKRTSIHLLKMLLGDTSSLIVNVAFTKCHSPVWNESGWQLHRPKSAFLTLRSHIIWTTKILRWWGLGSLSTWFASTIRYLHSRISVKSEPAGTDCCRKKDLVKADNRTLKFVPLFGRTIMTLCPLLCTHIIIYFCHLGNPCPAASLNAFFSCWLLDQAQEEIHP